MAYCLRKPKNKIEELQLINEKWIFKSKSLREMCPNTEFFLVSIFLYSD